MVDSPEKNPSTGDDKESGSLTAVIVGNASPEAASQNSKGPGYSRVPWHITWAVFVGIAAFVGVAGLFYGIAHWAEERIDKTVERKLSDEVILRKIAAQSRPALIFDANESITADMGAAQLVKEIRITTKDPDGWPTHVHIDFNKHLAIPPILTSMHEICAITPSRGKGLSWEFQITDVVQHGFIATSNLWAYRLELAP